MKSAKKQKNFSDIVMKLGSGRPSSAIFTKNFAFPIEMHKKIRYTVKENVRSHDNRV